MFAQSDRIILSATDLNNYLGCRHATFLDLAALRQPEATTESDPYLDLLQKKGLEHEQKYLSYLKGQGKRIAEINRDSTIGQRVAQTLSAMAEGHDVIYQGTLFDAPWMGYADFLVRVDQRSHLREYFYEVIDTKLARTARPTHVIQLCVYSKLLGAVQEQLPANIHLVMGDLTQLSLPLTYFLYYVELAQRRIEAFVAAPPRLSFGEPCGHCGYCRWQDHCTSEWERIDHLSLVANISRSQIAKLKAVSVDTVRKLSNLASGATIPNLQRETLSRLRQQAQLQIIKRDTGTDRYELLELPPGKGFARMPKPDPGDLFFDMEGDPLAEGGLEYLFGFVYTDSGVNRFKAFWAHSRTEEKSAYEEAMDFIVRRFSEYPDAHIYHYASYEETAIKRLSVLHGKRESELDNLLRQHKLVDLYKVVREGLRLSEPRYSLKNLETFYMGKRQSDVRSGGESIVVYEEWRELGDPALLKQIEDYNATDCHSILQLREWLLKLRPQAIPWFTGAVTDENETEREESRTEAEKHLHLTTAHLLDHVPEQEKEYRELVSQLLEFHRREAKPQWWAMFNRQELSEEELIDDADCIGGLRADPSRPPQADKRSLIHTFRFPPQDYKLGVGDHPLRADTLENVGEIVELDDEQFTVSLRIGNKAPPFPETFSLIPGKPIKTEVLRDAIYRYADAVIAGTSRYRAITSLLRKQLPAVDEVESGEPIIKGDSTLATAVTAICGLKNSYLLVQGPPGTGKTFTASHAIIELLAKGKRVGVSSNSHKAINTLLASIERLAAERKFMFRGAKKCSDDDHGLGGRFIEDIFDNQTVVSGNYDLVAGTAWLFARTDLDQALDYVFIDEAGQVSLANIIAIGVSARNIVLIGDQMQLAQPTQGIHPGKSGLSALEYALGDHATVPPSLGIFLNQTRRMHPDLCRFVSDAFYDSRLIPDPANRGQKLVLRANTDQVLAPTGIRFVEVDHTNCSQSSQAEAERLATVYDTLMGKRWINSQGTEAPVQGRDILVVSPYNMQVDLLRRMLPIGARVGTVDKFQGQEAAVVLISMATSSAEDMPHNIEFLYSRNRLNVAISRARCLAVIFANPRLLETPCSNIEQMRLVNAWCWAKAYAGT
jgi:predicted RecB family nuclease